MTTRLALLALVASAATSAHAADFLPGGADVVPAPLSFNISAYGGLGHGTYDAGSSWDIGFYGAEAHAGVLHGPIGIEGDAWGSGTKYALSSDGSVSHAYFLAAGLHLNRRTEDGVFGALVSVGTMPEGYQDTIVNTALEAQKDFGRLTLSGQAGYIQTVAVAGPSGFSLGAPTGWYANGIARWFPRDNLMLSGEFGYAWLHGEANQSAVTPRWGVRLEYKTSSAPISAFLAYQGYYWDQGSSGGGTVHAVSVGLTFIGGGETLAARYRGVAGLDDRNPIYGVANTQ